MSEERLKEIKDTIYCLDYEFAVRSIGKTFISKHLQQERELYNEVFRLIEENETIRKQNLYEHKYGSEMEGKYIVEKAKNDKAIEYIEENYFTPTINDLDKKWNLLNILRGNNE